MGDRDDLRDGVEVVVVLSWAQVRARASTEFLDGELDASVEAGELLDDACRELLG